VRNNPPVSERTSPNGPARADFPETRWSVVIAAGQVGEPIGKNALAELCCLYWYPIFAHLRRGGRSATEAQDLTQAFFLHILERGALRRADQLKGSFRGFLIGCLKHFESNERERAQALKRGGNVTFVPFDLEAAEHQYHRDGRVGAATSPELAFDRRWARVVTDNALERIRQQFAGDLSTYERLKGFLIPGNETGSYQEVAKNFGVPISLLKSAIHRLRRDYRDAVRREIATTVSAPHEVDDEMRHLVNVLSDE